MPRADGSRSRYARLALSCAAVSATLASATAAAEPTAFDIQPFLQHLDTTSVRVRFRTTANTAATVVVQPASEGPAVRVDAPDGRRMHDVPITGLSSSTSYTYFVEVGPERSAKGSFTTAPTDPTRPFSFIVYGDCRSNPADHASVVRAVEVTPSDFLVQTGDLVDRGDRDASWRSFFAIEAELLRDRSLFVAIGNHDLDGLVVPARDVYLRFFGTSDNEASRPYFSFRWANTRFFVLDAMDRWDGPQSTWLREQLEASDRERDVRHRIVAMHHGPFSSGPHGANSRFVHAGFVDLLRRHRVSLILAGHDHIYERGEAEGLRYVVTGGAGAPLYEVREHAPGSQVALSTLHFVHVQVHGEQVRLTARGPTGEVLDRCAFVDQSPWQCEPTAEAHAAPGGPPAEVKRRTRTRCGCETPGGDMTAAGTWGSIFAAFVGLFAYRTLRRDRHRTRTDGRS